MATRRRRTFRDILRSEAPRIAQALEKKARIASRLAKIQPHQASQLYSLKYTAVRQLFRIPGQMPAISDAWTTHRGYLLSIQLRRTGSSLHCPFRQLPVLARQVYIGWVTQRAVGKCWHASTRSGKSSERVLRAEVRA